MDWVTIDTSRVVGALTVTRRAAYDAWILANQDKEARVAGMVANLVMEFRSGIAANAANVLDADESKVPQACVRHCEALCIFTLCTEMEATLTEAEMLTAGKAEIFLRSLYYGRFVLAPGSGGTPRYSSVDEHAERKADLRTLIAATGQP